MRSYWLIAMLFAAPSLAQGPAAPGPLRLEEAVALALATEPLVDDARIAAEQARLGLLRAQLDRVSLRVDAQLTELWSALDGEKTRQVGASGITAKVEVPLFAGFRIQARVAQAREQVGAASAGLEAERRRTALSVARAYWSAQRLALARAVVERALERLALAQQIAEARMRAGIAPPIDTNRVASQRAQQQAELASLAGQLEGTLAELGVLLGLPEAPTLAAAALTPVSIRELAPADAWVSEALTDRAELRVLRHQREAAAQAVRIARSDFYPQLSLFGQYGYGNDLRYQSAFAPASPYATSFLSSSDPFLQTTGAAHVGVTLSLNLFDTLRTYTATKDAEYGSLRSQLQLRDGAQEVEREVRLAHARVQELWNQKDALDTAEALSRDNVSILRKRYENGDALMLELLDSEIELLRIERQLSDVQAELQLAVLELEAAKGRIVGVEKSS